MNTKIKIEPILRSFRWCERKLGIENGTFWRDFVETKRIPVVDITPKNSKRQKFRVREKAIEEFAINNEGFPEAL